jgi:hypothetical protein
LYLFFFLALWNHKRELMKPKSIFILLFFLVACSKEPAPLSQSPASASSTGTISTLSGPGKNSSSYSGDGGPAVDATVGWPTAVAVDAAGNIYFTDGAFNTVRKITLTTTIINTIAGTVYPSTDPVRYSGDGGLATQARLNIPLSLTIGQTGNVYVADAGNNAIREISNNIIESLVGKPSNPFGGYSGDGGLSTNASLFNPYAVAVAANGDLFIADSENNAIRKVDHATGIITTVAGQGPGNPGYSGDGGEASKAKLNFPQGIAVDIAGNIYFTDQQLVVRLINPSGIISTFVGNGVQGSAGDGGAAIQANLNSPAGLAVDDAGNLFIADAGNQAIRKVSATTKSITTVAGILGQGGFSGDGGSANLAKLNTPLGVAVDKSGNIYIVDSQNQRIRVVKPN